MKIKLFQLFLFVFVDVLGFSLVLPLLPFYAEQFSTSPTVIGFLLTSNALSQLIMSPIIGRLSDIHGRRPLLIACLVGTIVSFVMLGAAQSVAMLFASRILDGLMGGNISLAQAYIADITTHDERAHGLGVVGAGFGIGFVVGPAVGGILTSVYGVRFPCFVAAFLSLVNLIGVIIWLPESLPHSSRKQPSGWTHISVFDFYRIFSNEKLRPLMLQRFAYLLVFTLFETSFGYFNKALSFSASTSSYLLCFVGVVYSLMQSRIGKLSRTFEERKLISAGFGLFSVSLFCWSVLTSNLTSVVISLIPISAASGMLQTLISSAISKKVPKDEQGEILGLSSAIGSFSRVIAPLMMGVLIDSFGFRSPGVVGALFMCLVALFRRKYY